MARRMATQGTDDFDALYRASYRRLVGELCVVTGCRAEAEDVVQEAFVRAFARWGRVSLLDQPAAWVRRVAINLAISSLRRARRTVARPRAERSVERSVEDALDVASALRTLPRSQRAVLVLHYVVGLPVVEVADQLGVAVGTVKSRLARGRDRLELLLADRGPDALPGHREEEVLRRD